MPPYTRELDLKIINAVKATEKQRRTEGLSDQLFWATVASHVPGYSPRDCAIRYETLYKNSNQQPGRARPQTSTAHSRLSTNQFPFSQYLQTGTMKQFPMRPQTGGPRRPASGTGRPRSARPGVNVGIEPARTVPSHPGSPSPEPVEDGRSMVTINVHDEGRGVDRQFTLPQDVLVAEMKYFGSCLQRQNTSSFEDIDISVHCDVSVFQWLVNYCTATTKPALDVRSIVSITISAEFLQMDSLVTHCVEFMAGHLQAVLDLPLDLSCVSNKLVSRIAQHLSPEAVAVLKDIKNKLVGRLFKVFADSLASSVTFEKCQLCNAIFNADNRSQYRCPEAKVFVDFHGDIISDHVADQQFSPSQWVQQLHGSLGTWQATYWRLWATSQSLQCSTCSSTFVASQLGHCTFHPSQPSFRAGTNTGHYPCCREPAVRFSTTTQRVSSGCQARDHTVITQDSGPVKDIVRLVTKFRDMCTEPFVARAAVASPVVDVEPDFSETDSVTDGGQTTTDTDVGEYYVMRPDSDTTVWGSKRFQPSKQDDAPGKRRQMIVDLTYEREVGRMGGLVGRLMEMRGTAAKKKRPANRVFVGDRKV